MASKSNPVKEQPNKQAEAIAPSKLVEMASDVSSHRSRCGGALRQARETQALTVQDVASKLRLGPKQIEAIEADQFEKLPEAMIVRGFIRNYAKLLKINVEPLLDAYTVIVPSSFQYELSVKPTSNMLVTNGDKPKGINYIWAALAALLALGAWMFYQNYIQKPSPTALTTNIESASKETLQSLPESALPAAERAAQQATTLQPSVELTLPPAADMTSSAPSVAASPVVPNSSISTVEPALVTSNTVLADVAPIASLPIIEPALAAAPAGMTKLEFSATQETWVNIVDANGREIYSKNIFAGRETMEVTPPVNVTVGNAAATSLNINGKAINLAPHSRNNVARIKVD